MWEKVFFLAFGAFLFCECVPCPSLFDNRQYFQVVDKKKWSAWEHAKKVVEGLGTDWFVTAINLPPHSCGCGKTVPGK